MANNEQSSSTDFPGIVYDTVSLVSLAVVCTLGVVISLWTIHSTLPLFTEYEYMAGVAMGVSIVCVIFAGLFGMVWFALRRYNASESL